MSSTPEEPNQPSQTPPGATPPATPPNDPPPPAPPADEPMGAGPDGTDPEQPRRTLNPLLALLLAVVVIAGAYVLLSGGDDDVNETIVPPPAATTPVEQPGETTPPATTPGDDQPGETPTSPEGGVAPGGDDTGADDPTAEAAKTAVRTLVPLIQTCFGETNSYEACLTHPTVVGSGISIAADPQPGQVRLKATADTFAIVAPDAGGRNWVFKKNAGVPSTRTCEERGEATCESKSW